MSVLNKRTFGWLGLAAAGVIAGLTPQSHAQDWIRQFGTSSEERPEALAPDGAGGVMVAGWTLGRLGGPNAGSYDVFLARFSVCDPCDMNGDGTVDAADIEFFIDILFNGATPCDICTGDTNGDGNIDAGDIEGFIDCLFP